MKTLALVLACVAILTVTVYAAEPAPMQAVTTHSGVIHPAQYPNLKTIYSTLGPAGDVYYDNGWYVVGPKVQKGIEQWIAMPFTPKAAVTATVIKIALHYASGSNAAEVVLAADASGLPGKTLARWNVKTLPPIKTCCTLVTVRSKNGIKLGTEQYWVIAKTDTASQDSSDYWAWTYNLSRGHFAYNDRASGWIAYDYYLSAFGVFGE